MPPIVNILFISCKYRFGRYLRNAGRMGVGIGLTRAHDLATTIHVLAKAFITYIRATVLAPIVLAADVFRTAILQ